MTIVPSVLHESELALPERMAARLDGELFAIGDGHAAIDEIERPVLRLQSVLGCRASRLIAELGTAAWVWGALPLAPARLEFCVDIRARARPPASALATVREVVLDPADIVALGAWRVTGPIRTAVDLARSRARYDDAERDAVRMLASVGHFGIAECRVLIDRTRNLPARRRAVQRLEATL